MSRQVSQVLTLEERDEILKFLRESSDDETLLQAAERTKESRVNIQKDYDSLRKYLGMKAMANGDLPHPKQQATWVASGEPPKDEEASPPAAKPKASKEEPPGVASSRVGGANKDAIIGRVRRSPCTPEELSSFIKVNLANTKALAKRLWVIKAIKWDGERYFI